MESALREGSRATGLRLIETLRWQDGGCRLLDRHLARLAAGAAALGWPCDRGAALAALRAAGGGGALRLRLTLAATGDIAVTSAPLPPAVALWRLGVADVRLRSDDPWLRLKSTNRASYDTARATLPAGLDEVVFLNERAEMCDGSISTLFFDRGQGMCTPPLTCGLLPGVLRADLLDRGCIEQVLRADDLGRVRLWLGNALRGLIPAALIRAALDPAALTPTHAIPTSAIPAASGSAALDPAALIPTSAIPAGSGSAALDPAALIPTSAIPAASGSAALDPDALGPQDDAPPPGGDAVAGKPG